MNDDELGNNDESLQSMFEAEIMAELMGLLSREGISDTKLRKILAYVERVLSG
ncbi:MAG TPA: hypothetical protein VF131_20750 [Blastocatellia bacterium]|nr:hypothetical protein [Blastocatellia bacterium]